MATDPYADPKLEGVSIRSLPKVSLHDHLDGALRPQTIIELADEIGLDVPSTDAEELADWFEDQSDSGSLVEYLKTFDLTTAVMQSADGLRRVAKEFVEDLAADGVIYGEVRWAPEQHLGGGLSLEEAVEAVQEGIEEGEDAVDRSGRDIRVGQLITAMRHADRSLEIARLAVAFRGRGAVGFDIAGAEDGFPPSRHRAAFDYLASEFFPVTVHAGEAAGLDSIRSAILDGRALRLGHGVRIAEDLEVVQQQGDEVLVTFGDLARWVRDREIPLELSPSSNLQTGAIAAWGKNLEDHPFDLLYQLGFAVTVNVDNRTMSRTSLTRELALLAETFDYRLEDLEAFQLNAAAGAFLSVEEREELIELIGEGFDA
ncbi:adenosine deaminase [Microbacterium laevaniformans]|uniref:adenosine deaminase n=1 Tax=Microbacterium laevaniformans TaxID=36807 RepID=A0A4S2DF18_9MICO|nr:MULTISPECIES: adenosine deaminase [Microbacterium]MDC7803377.1 adenosine deaminase [Sphingomonas sp. BLCC-B65]AXA97297.1 adenosine deaminase [Microbacterium sp. PM5]MBM7751745.1 adenosine deaminase [Microbacterium laevaniformans]TGY39294.1 adenosine deaminase [Microbacterium laevaniformans]GLJ63902.1 adenosine deaminase 1 [Microbacterium laevaniformans]